MKKIMFAVFVLFATVFASSSRANITGTHLQNFNPDIDGMCFVTVQCSQTLDPGYVNLGIFANYAWNSLPYFRNPAFPTTQQFKEPHNRLLSGDFNLALGILKGWDVGASLPYALSQSSDSFSQLGTYEDTGLTEWKLYSKVRFAGDETWGLAAVGTVSFDRISNNPYAGNDPGPTFTGELAYDYKLNPDWLFGANLGYRLRDDGAIIAGTGVKPIGDQFIYSSAIAYMYHSWETAFIGEVYGSIPTDDQSLPTNRQPSNLEFLLGAKHTIAERWDVHAGITREVYQGLATPDLRIYLGVNWRIGPLMSRSQPAPPLVIETKPLTVESDDEPPDDILVLHSLNFDTNLTTLTKTSQVGFKDIIAQLREKNPDIRRIIVEGHTDDVGTDAYNMKLSQGRAETVRALLMSGMNLRSDQVKAVGRGKTHFISPNNTAAGRAKNRRVELKIYRNK